MAHFFDSHFHVQNFTHPQLEAFIDRLRSDSKITRLFLKPVSQNVLDLSLIIGGTAGVIAGLYRMVDRAFDNVVGKPHGPTVGHLRIINLLLMMNRPIDVYLQEIDDEVSGLIEDGQFRIPGGPEFDKLIVSALIMDYTDRDYRQSWTSVFPYAQTSKPVVRQTEDLLAGIKRYREQCDGDPKLIVLPFLGLNPENYGFRATENYVILPLRLDANALPDGYLSGNDPKALYNPSTGRFQWLKKQMSDEEREVIEQRLIINPAKPGLTPEAISLLATLQHEVNGGQAVRSVMLTAKPEINYDEWAEKCTWTPMSDGSGTCEWLADTMNIEERDALVAALPSDEDADTRSKASWSYSKGRIEFLFRQLQGMSVEGEGEPGTIQDLMEQFFSDRQATFEELTANQSAWPGHMEQVGRNVFAGIKFYPPLGFDPNPDGTIHQNSRKKRAWYIYDFCQSRGIPITVHTSDGGYKILSDEQHKLYTSPRRWLGVLRAFPNLHINFAHCGVQGADMSGDHEWKKILFKDIICAEENGTWKYPNVYADVSDLLNTKEAYAQFEEGMAALKEAGLNEEYQWEHIGNRLLFGSDFMINLRESESYKAYVSGFTVNAGNVWARNINGPIQLSDAGLRRKMSVDNPIRFHFGGI